MTDGRRPDDDNNNDDNDDKRGAKRPERPKLGSDKQERLITALMTARSLKDAAEQADISYSTAKRIMATPEAAARLAEVRQEMAKDALLEATQLARLARETLAAVMQDPRTPAYAKVAAATAALQYDKTISDLFAINQRLADLEAKLDEQAERDDRPPAAAPAHPRPPAHHDVGPDEFKETK